MDVTSYLLGKNAGGGGTPTLQEKEITITENGTTSVTADAGYDGLSEVEVTTNISATASPEFVSFRGYSGNTLDLSWLRTENIKDMNSMFRDCLNLKTLDLSKFDLQSIPWLDTMFRNDKALAILDISGFEVSKIRGNGTNTFYDCGVSCQQSDGAYANGIPYVYVKDEDMQHWVLTNTSIPTTWTTANVVIK